MHLTAIEGMTDSEIGDALAISAASVRSHRRRAREVMARILPQTITGEAMHE
jgi:DNA-directed RNA polymerase specialized sigma24 family protein